MGECIKDAFYRLKGKLAEGIPEIHVPPLEPLVLDRLEMRSGPWLSRLNINVTNLQLWGGTTAQILEIHPEIPSFRINIPNLCFQANYDVDVNLMIFSYKGKGPISGNLTNFNAYTEMKMEIKLMRGKMYLQLTDLTLKLKMDNGKYYLSELFSHRSNVGAAFLHITPPLGQDNFVGSIANAVINENSELLMGRLMPDLEKSLAKALMKEVNEILAIITYEEFFSLHSRKFVDLLITDTYSR
ncbi:hypothetical protein JTB14_038254 [Gonioctena quinquepunctata]|nr:hypothetical protein JTB14_038254 [Gonioctena quinquepunctata]